WTGAGFCGVAGRTVPPHRGLHACAAEMPTRAVATHTLMFSANFMGRSFAAWQRLEECCSRGSLHATGEGVESSCDLQKNAKAHRLRSVGLAGRVLPDGRCAFVVRAGLLI